MRVRQSLSVALLIAAASPARAEWYQASSEHFLIYSEQNPAQLRQFAEKLEKFDGAVRALRGMEDMPLSKGNRVTIFVVDEQSFQKLSGDKTGFTRGFYRGSAAGSIAVVDRPPEAGKSRGGGRTAIGSRLQPAFDPDYELGADTVLLHEYAHHLMMQALSSPLPEWLIEGFAEFMASARFERDGSVGLGLPAKHRAFGLAELKPLPLETLLSGKYDKITVGERESVYGRGWLLTHYLTFEPSRSGQLARYIGGIARGLDPLDAARQAFGDLDQLDRDLGSYLRRSALEYRKVSGAALQFAPIAVTPLSDGFAAVLPHFVKLKNGVADADQPALAQQIRGIQSLHPGDPDVETVLAEAELEVGRAAEANAAADRALKARPKSTDAMILKGKAMMVLAKNAVPRQAALFAAARRQFTSANQIDPEDPEPLMEFYYSYPASGLAPTANAVAALHYASDLAPHDLGLRINLALQYIRDGKLKEARLALAPIAYSPHGREIAALARAMIAKIDLGDKDAAEKAAFER